MDWQHIADWAGHVSAILTAIGLAAALVWGAVKARADWKQTNVAESADAREAEAHEAEEARARDEEQRHALDDLLKVKDEMIEALRDDREELRQQLKRALDREARQASRINDLERRLNDVEKESRQSIIKVLEAVMESDRCERKDCPERAVPGDRREFHTTS